MVRTINEDRTGCLKLCIITEKAEKQKSLTKMYVCVCGDGCVNCIHISNHNLHFDILQFYLSVTPQ